MIKRLLTGNSTREGALFLHFLWHLAKIAFVGFVVSILIVPAVAFVAAEMGF